LYCAIVFIDATEVCLGGLKNGCREKTVSSITVLAMLKLLLSDRLKFTRNALSAEASVYLNILRVAACEVVVISHFYTRYRPLFLDSIFFGGMLGGLGVFTFFAISGFLISYSIYQKTLDRQYRFRHYFVDRFSRIYSGLIPALLISLAVAGLIYATNPVYFNHLLAAESPINLQTFTATLSMTDMIPSGLVNATSNVALGVSFSQPMITSFGFNSVLWSLMVEWWIYMFFGWVILGGLVLLRREKVGGWFRPMFYAVTVFLSAVLLVLAWQYSAFIIVWFLGAAAMCLLSNTGIRMKLKGRLATYFLAALFYASIAGVGYESYRIYTLTHESFSLLFGLLISSTVLLGVFIVNMGAFSWISKLLQRKRLVRWSISMAAFSYTLFLIHYPILLFLNGLNFEGDRMLLLIPILLMLNEAAFIVASFTEKRHKALAEWIQRTLHFNY
jgi:peptidoglycan/LPS O-acetylase OafA/YrhL